tara:strand:+ start:1044 stop:1292 length:249 start_codon:yes stop_codon:yes gene_type:complete
MFENFGTALTQLVGFLGVFAFFIYQLISDKTNQEVSSIKTRSNQNKVLQVEGQSQRKGLFGRKSVKVNESNVTNKPKKGWFK